MITNYKRYMKSIFAKSQPSRTLDKRTTKPVYSRQSTTTLEFLYKRAAVELIISPSNTLDCSERACGHPKQNTQTWVLLISLEKMAKPAEKIGGLDLKVRSLVFLTVPK